jgi:hypothetical protein
VTTEHATLGPDRPFEVTMARRDGETHPRWRADIYPSTMTALVGGFEGIITCPHG